MTTESTTTSSTDVLDKVGRNVLDSVAQVQNAALSVSRDWLSRLAEFVPAVPGVPADVLERPAHLVDRGFEAAEEAIGGTSGLVGDALHRQRDFVMDVFGALQPIVNALASTTSES
jgi:hypothetical protein